jgi:acetyl-CoA synthetase
VDKIISLYRETRVLEPDQPLIRTARIKDLQEYRELHRKSLDDPEGFWAAYARELEWYKPWKAVLEEDFARGKVQWFAGGKLNASVNCLDRHLATPRKHTIALRWEGESGETRTYTFERLHEEVSRCANAFRNLGIGKGDRVALYLPMIPELPIAMLACARVGAVHSVIFSRFSAASLRQRIVDCGARILVTSDYGRDGGHLVSTKTNADAALEGCPTVQNVIVVPHVGERTEMVRGRDHVWTELLARETSVPASPPEAMDSEDPLFILYTSGSTGKPKGVLHSTAGYLLHAKKSFEWVFDYQEGDVFWCTEDLGWITGHTYGVYGPLCAGATTVMLEGGFHYPRPDRLWETVEKHRIGTLYTTPAVLRACMNESDDWVRKHDLRSLRILGTVGEPITPDTWMWYYRVVGQERCPVVDTWWQTETGGIMISPLPGIMPLKPGSAALPFFGADPAVLRDDGSPCEADEGGYLVLRRPWPGMMRSIHGAPEGFRDKYFDHFDGSYFTGDGARKDEDGYYWLLGRVDDVIHSSGYRLGTAEIESAIISYEAVAEAAVVGFPDRIKGQGICAFVTLRPGFEPSDEMKQALMGHVRKKIGSIAAPDRIQFVDHLSKTLSGKILRRILRKVAAGEMEDLGDLSTLADPSPVRDLMTGRRPG